MNFKINKLDRRHNGNGLWKYYITVKRPTTTRREAKNTFFQIRDWAWTTWGPSKELLEWVEDQGNIHAHCQNEHWSWQSDIYHVRLYLRTDKELSFFLLRWS